jgi:hypothetical protein
VLAGTLATVTDKIRAGVRATFPKEYQSLGGRDGFLAFCRSLTWFGAAPAQWTTHVLGGRPNGAVGESNS